MKILYVHGYNGNPYGESYQNLKNACGDNHELHTIDYDASKPTEALEHIFNYIYNHKIDLVIGASLGGFLTMNLYGVSRIVVNPCWNPAIELPKIGYTGDTEVYENMFNDMCSSLDFEEKHLCTAVSALDDELLGQKYTPILRKYFHRHYLINGVHRISPEMAKVIINDILPVHEYEVEKFCEQLANIDNAPWL